VSAPPVSVVIPHYRSPRSLALVLTALELQDHPLDRLEVVVADDGSPEAPEPGDRPYPVRVVRQEDLGFRGAAARNLGARASHGSILLFLDQDTLPEPSYVRLMVASLTGSVLAVGHRRHADLDGWAPAQVRRWLTGAGEAPCELEEPRWLLDAYAGSDNLRAADDRSYRFVIGAVLGITRELFDRVGGFEESFTRYGGEDWELANRCWIAGADLVHLPGAVAWHDGPDFAGRDWEHERVKYLESVAVAALITEPGARGRGLVWAQPDVVIRLHDEDWEAADAVACAQSLLRDTDAGVWLFSGRTLVEDPRVHAGRPAPEVLGRCRYQVDVREPVHVRPGQVRQWCDAAPVLAGEHVTVRRTRDLARGDGTATRVPAPQDLSGTSLESWWASDLAADSGR
jgi:GT2 family glycosyltransferase